MANLYLILSYICFFAFFVFAIPVFRKKTDFFRGVFISSASLIASFVFTVMSYNAQTGANFIDLFINEQFSSLSRIIGSMSEDAINSAYGISVTDMLKALNSAREMYSVIFPSVIILTALFLSLIYYMIVKNILRILGKDVSAHPDFIMFKMPKSSVFVLLLTMAVSALSDGTVSNICLNIVTVLTSIFALCGIALVLFWLKIRIKSPFLRALAYTGTIFAVVILMNITIYILGMISIADAFLDLRKIRSKGGYDEQTR